MNWELHITGQVQGVGFRPLVYQLATELNLRGQVANGNDGVRILIDGTEAQAQALRERLLAQPPRLATITSARLKPVPGPAYADFTIEASEENQPASLLISPDFGICADCREELSQPADRRWGYAFNTCTNCGPRYSIMRSLPYDRVSTTMAPFVMCEACAQEYHNPGDRRHFSQTNSCPDCGVSLYVLGSQDQANSQEEILQAVVSAWKAGEVVALKGIGGFLLTCAAHDYPAVQRLRARKHRPDKPLALMYPSLSAVRAAFFTSPVEAEALSSPIAPIVLLRPRSTTQLPGVAPELERMGVMLPYAPLFEALLASYGQPIVATSGNCAGEPIVFQEKGATEALGRVADLIVSHDREICVPQDDSVVTYTDQGRRIIHRRARGLAPTYIHAELAFAEQEILAAGADLKSSFAVLHANHAYLSQYLGDLGSFTAQHHYQLTRDHLLGVLGAQPQLVLTDRHPAYSSTTLAHQFAAERSIPIQAIQHHEAHFAAILGEHNLLATKQPILGVIWDGTGLGDDGQMWGGEFFSYAAYHITRVQHLDYFPVLAGDKMAKEPRLSALALAGASAEVAARLRPRFSPTEWAFYQKLTPRAERQTTSVGRLFDAVACLLGLGDTQTYEGMVASRLEALARTAASMPAALPAWVSPALPAVVADLETLGPAQAALRFHLRLVDKIRTVARQQQATELAFSGGVFQNTLLVELIERHLGLDFNLYFHEQLAPNDENIAFGQLVHHTIATRRATTKSTHYVLSNSR